MSAVKKNENLKCWKATRVLTREIYRLSHKGGLIKKMDMKSQMGGAGLFSMNNIIDGFSRYSNKEFIGFLNVSQSSAANVKNVLYQLTDLNYVENSRLMKLHEDIDEIRKLTHGLIKHLKAKQH